MLLVQEGTIQTLLSNNCGCEFFLSGNSLRDKLRGLPLCYAPQNSLIWEWPSVQHFEKALKGIDYPQLHVARDNRWGKQQRNRKSRNRGAGVGNTQENNSFVKLPCIFHNPERHAHAQGHMHACSAKTWDNPQLSPLTDLWAPNKQKVKTKAEVQHLAKHWRSALTQSQFAKLNNCNPQRATRTNPEEGKRIWFSELPHYNIQNIQFKQKLCGIQRDKKVRDICGKN